VKQQGIAAFYKKLNEILAGAIIRSDRGAIDA
jgi:hypothetical protein